MYPPAKFFITLLLPFFTLTAQGGSPAISPSLIIDVRTADEYRQGHVQDALNIPYDEIASRITAIAPDHTTPLVLYCRSGHRAGLAEQALRQIGYDRIENKGGLDDMRRGGYSIQ